LEILLSILLLLVAAVVANGLLEVVAAAVFILMFLVPLKVDQVELLDLLILCQLLLIQSQSVPEVQVELLMVLME
jgi:hypothetical protein